MSDRTGQLRSALAARSRALVDSAAFTAVVFCLILGNAALLGIETYAGCRARMAHSAQDGGAPVPRGLHRRNTLRAAAYADRPGHFFRDPWNVFDLAVVALAFMPFARENATVLRLLRLARVVRAARFLPQLRIVIVAVGKSLPGTVSFVLVGALLLYIYAMVGWVFFAAADPEHYGSLGRAALTLFLLITLDGLGDAVRAGLEISRWTIVYFASFVLLGSFVLVNLLIGVVINSLQEARELEAEQNDDIPAPRTPPSAEAELREQLAAARRALDDIEAVLARSGPGEDRQQDSESTGART